MILISCAIFFAEFRNFRYSRSYGNLLAITLLQHLGIEISCKDYHIIKSVIRTGLSEKSSDRRVTFSNPAPTKAEIFSTVSLIMRCYKFLLGLYTACERYFKVFRNAENHFEARYLHKLVEELIEDRALGSWKDFMTPIYR